MSERERVVVRATKIPPARRDVSGPVLSRADAGYEDIYGSLDGGDGSPLFERVAYVAHLTPEQIKQFKAASNCLTVEPDEELTADLVEVEPITDPIASTVGIPEADVLTWMGDDVAELTGAGVRVAVLDGGISPQVRARMGNRVVATKNFSGVETGEDGITTEHGCFVAPVCVPSGSEVLDAIIGTNEGSSRTSWFASAVRWAIANGAKVINYSYSGGATTSIARDTVQFAQDNNVLVFCSAGNDNQYVLGSPSDLCRSLWAMHSSIAFDHRTSLRAPFSNHHEDGSGCTPGKSVLSLNKLAVPLRVSGTSFSSPLKAYAAAVLLTGGRFTPRQVSDALKATVRDTAASPQEEGKGRWHVRAAWESLTATQPPPPSVPTPPPAPTPVPVPVAPWRLKLQRALARTRWCVTGRANGGEKTPFPLRIAWLVFALRNLLGARGSR